MTGFPENGEFMKYFNMWIDSPSDPCPLGGKAPYSKAMSYNKTNIIASTFRKAHRPLNSQADFISAYLDAKLIASSVEDIEVFAYSPFYIYYVQYESMVCLTMKLLGSAVLLIFIATTISLGSIQTAAILSLTILMILIDISAVMTWSNITLNAVSLVNLIICVGLAVEFCIHIARAYSMIPRHIRNDRDSRVMYAMNTVGKSVFTGITMTKIIGVFYFRMWFSLVFIAAIHSLVFLPVTLSTAGGKYHLNETVY